MNKKYELVLNDKKEFAGRTLYRIRSIVAIGSLVSPGQLGGYIEKGSNLSVYGDAWVFGNAQVYGDAQVFGYAQVRGNAQVFGNAQVRGNARVEKTFHYMNIAQVKFNLTFTLHNVAGGCRLFTHDEFRNLTKENCESEWREGELENYKAFQELFWKQVEINDPTLKCLIDVMEK